MRGNQDREEVSLDIFSCLSLSYVGHIAVFVIPGVMLLSCLLFPILISRFPPSFSSLGRSTLRGSLL